MLCVIETFLSELLSWITTRTMKTVRELSENHSFSSERFLPARRYVIATCLSVRPSVCHAPVLCQNEES